MNHRITIIAVSFIIIINSLIFVLVSNKSKKSHRIDEKDLTVINGQLSEGEVLGNILTKQEVELLDVRLITDALNKVFNLRKCNVGDKWKLYLDSKGNFVKFEYYDGPMEFYVVEPDIDNNTYIASIHEIKAKKIIRGTRGKITSSLYESMTSLNVHSEVVVQFAEIFASTIDFFTDCRPDDEFSILWDSYVDKDGVVLKDKNILAASYTRSGDTYYAFFYKTPDGKSKYYDENGESVEAAFLKAPLNYRRISSHFTRRRFHPILKKYRPHLGIDYAAPRGTPISSIGDGVVISAGRRGGLGIAVIVRHPNNYKSWYGHLSKIAKGVSKGSRIKKSQVIGYVGSTGLSTGPHLDFRLQKGKTFVNFLALKLPPSNPLPNKYQKKYMVAKNMFMETTDNLKPGEITVFQNKKARKLYSLY